MKSERRHELQHNALLVWLEEAVERIKPYQNAILGGFLLVVVILVAISVWSSRSASYAGDGWAAMRGPFSPPGPDDLDKVARQFPDTSAAPWATLLAADQYLATGCGRLFENKAAASDDLNKAFERYQAVYLKADSDWLRERAAFGIARALEAQGTADKIEEAMQYYKEVVEKWPDGMFKAAAQLRLDDLQKPSTKKFYDEFARFEPKPAMAREAGQPAQKDTLAAPPDNPPDESPLKYHSPFGTDFSEKGKDSKSKTPAKGQ